MFDSLRTFGITRLTPRLAALAFWSFISGLSQAGVLIILSDAAVSRAGGHHDLRLAGHTISLTYALLIAGALILVFFVAGLISARLSGDLYGYVMRSGRDAVIDRFFAASWAVQSEERLGEVQQLLTVNAERLGGVSQSLAGGLVAFFNVVALVLVAFLINPLSALGVLLIGVVLYAALRPFNSLTAGASKAQASASRLMSTTVTSYTRLAREFRLLGVTKQATSQLHEINADAAATAQRTRVLLLIMPVVYSTITLVLVVAGLGLLASLGSRSMSSIGAVLLILLRTLSYGSQLQTTSQQFASYRAFIADLEAKIDAYAHDAYEDGSAGNPTDLSLSCRHVSYAYDGDHDVLRDISFEVAAGSIVGIVGHSGSGKSTLAQLLLGMRRPSTGELLVGGVHPADLILQSGSSPLSLVAQDPVLLDGTIAFNVALFRDVSHEQVEAACRLAHLHEDILGLPEGYDTPVGEGGGALSGGQRQRLAIARALIGSPLLLVLDEPTSALDGRSERLLRESLENLRGSVTVAIISHRLSTVDICDELLVLEGGSLAAAGPSEMVRASAPFAAVMEMLETDAERPWMPS